MGSANSKTIQAEGFVAPGFESVKQMFENNFQRGADESSQLCVYVGEEKVVDLWFSTTNTTFTGDTLINVFSSTKSLTAIAMAALVDKGVIKYSDKIATHWPEFGQKDKGDITIADLMRHEAGLANFDAPFDASCTLRENIKQNAMGEIIAKQSCFYPEGTKREYHSLSRGWIANEIFRRAHPAGKTLGEYLQEEVNTPLLADVFVGVPDSRFDHYAPVIDLNFKAVLSGCLNPMNTSVDTDLGKMMGMMNMLRKYNKDGRNKEAFLPFDGKKIAQVGAMFNQPVVRKGESSSANGNCSARGLAKVAAAMANGGSLNGVQVLSPSAWDSLHANPTKEPIFGMPINFTQGGLGKFEEMAGFDVEGYYGWMGYGGSIFQWHPQLKVGFAFTCTMLHWYDMHNSRGRTLQSEVLKCVKNRK